MNTLKKKGFTLIELMIVLAIIAILAVVLIPKSGIFKNQSKNAGVVTNVNTVRAYLETKIADNDGTSDYLTDNELELALEKSFNLNTSTDANTVKNAPKSTAASGEKLVNPLNQAKASIVVSDGTYTVGSDDQGKVVIEVSAAGYTVYGIDNGGSKIQVYTIK